MSPAPAHWPQTRGIDTAPDASGFAYPHLRGKDVNVVDVLEDLSSGADYAEVCHWNRITAPDMAAVMRFSRACVIELDRLISGHEPMTRKEWDQLRRKVAAAKAMKERG